MTELTIERVRELIHGYDDATQAKSKSGGWPNPEYADAESARVARYWLLNRFGPLAFGRLVLSLYAQLQQERKGQEKLIEQWTAQADAADAGISTDSDPWGLRKAIADLRAALAQTEAQP